MHLACPNCNYHVKQAGNMDCPICGSDLEPLSRVRSERRLQKTRKPVTISHRSPRWPRRSSWSEVEVL